VLAVGSLCGRFEKCARVAETYPVTFGKSVNPYRLGGQKKRLPLKLSKALGDAQPGCAASGENAGNITTLDGILPTETVDKLAAHDG